MDLILYSKPGCHLCEGLQEKLEQVQNPAIELEIRDITTREDWLQAYEYEIPVLFWVRHPVIGAVSPDHVTKPEAVPPPAPFTQLLPRLSPRATVQQVEQMLQKYNFENGSESVQRE